LSFPSFGKAGYREKANHPFGRRLFRDISYRGWVIDRGVSIWHAANGGEAPCRRCLGSCMDGLLLFIAWFPKVTVEVNKARAKD
jgi:hypothetical protein